MNGKQRFLIRLVKKGGYCTLVGILLLGAERFGKLELLKLYTHDHLRRLIAVAGALGR